MCYAIGAISHPLTRSRLCFLLTFFFSISPSSTPKKSVYDKAEKRNERAPFTIPEAVKAEGQQLAKKIASKNSYTSAESEREPVTFS